MEIQLCMVSGHLRHLRTVNHGEKSKELFYRLAAEENVVADGQIVGQRQILIDRLDPIIAGFLRRGESNALAIEIDIALVILEDAGDRLDQRRLARTVVAGKGHDFSRENVERGVHNCMDAAEAFRDALTERMGPDYSTCRPRKRRWLWSTSTEMMITQPTA